MRAVIKPSRPCGTVKAPPSKSAAHRALICAALAQGQSNIGNIDYSQDILATLDCLNALGVQTQRSENSVKICGGIKKCESAILNCRESGSTLRFLMPLSLLGGEIKFIGSERLMSRPLDIYENIFSHSGVLFKRDKNSITVKGELKAGKFTVKGNVSSQFITGLMFALPLLNGESQIEIQPPFESKPYVDMTAEALKRAGITVISGENDTIFIDGGQRYISSDVTVEGDWSNAAFFDFFNLFGGDVKIVGLNPDSTQGDRIYREYFKKLNSGKAAVDLSDCPDLGPVLMAASFKNGAVFTGVERLRLKESDRCEAMARELAKFGIQTENGTDTFTVYPSEIHTPAEILSGHNDHRIVMALSDLCTLTGGTIDGVQAVSKSLPQFFDILGKLKTEVKLYETAQ